MMAFGKRPLGGRNSLKLSPVQSLKADTIENLFAEKPAFYLVVLDYFRGIFVKHGVDYERLRLIIQVKMAINVRALQNPLMESSARSGRSASSGKKKGFLKGLIFQGIFGLIFSLVVLLPIPDFAVYLLLYSAFFMLYISFLIPQLAQVFLSVEDAQVLPVRPVDARVLSLAKVLQVTIYYAINYVLFIGPTLLVGFLKRDFTSAFLAIPTSLLLSAFALLLALAMYLLVAQFFSGEKLRNMITFVQILLSMFSFATYQLIAPLINLFHMTELSLSPWMLVWPPTWFCAPFELKADGTSTVLAYIATALGVLSVAILGVLYFAQSAKLEQRLQDLAMQKDGEDRDSGRIRDFFSRILCRNPQERAYFRFAWQMFRHERSFKAAVYPLLVTYAALPYIMIITTSGETETAGLFPGMPIFFLYMSIIGIANVILSVQMSDYAEGGWLFRILPERSDGDFSTALAKCIWSKLYIPLYLLQFPLQYLLNGRMGVLTIGILFFMSYLLTQYFILTMPLKRPFTQTRTLLQQEGCGYMFVLFALWIGLVLIQGALQTYVPYGMEIYVGLLGLITVLIIRFYRSKKVFQDD